MNIMQLRAAVVAMPECEILVFGGNTLEYKDARSTGNGCFVVPGEVADKLLAAGRADLTDATRAKLRQSGVAI
jgi:hypothetical protein